MKAIKYLKNEYLESFIKNGIIRIGTLKDYRSTEKYNSAIADIEEGTGQVFATNERIVGSAYRNTIPGFKISGNSQANIGPSSKISSRIQVRNFYLFCVSQSFDEQTQLAFETDGCVEINDIEIFGKAITDDFPESVNFVGACECIYVGRQIHHLSNLTNSIHLLKDEEYSYQREIRLIWVPKHTNPIHPFVHQFSKTVGLSSKSSNPGGR